MKEHKRGPDNLAVTPAMEAAGIDALRGFDPEFDCPGERAILVFKAMMASGTTRQSPDCSPIAPVHLQNALIGRISL